MSEFIKCPTCGRSQGQTAYRCCNCGNIGCSVCYKDYCPKCAEQAVTGGILAGRPFTNSNWETVGTIQRA